MFVRTGRARLVVFVLLPRALAGWMRAVFREVLKHVKVDRVARNLLLRRTEVGRLRRSRFTVGQSTFSTRS